MALVDYSSDSGPDSNGEDGASRVVAEKPPKPPLPPLPSLFHDLYASTVRPSTRDDPALHHGRTRQIPHVVGNWPSHVYVEWFPTVGEHELLSSLLSALREQLGAAGDGLHSFLTSDLATPLPLHISLSRPFTLTADEKDDFLDRMTVAIRQQTPVAKFAVHPHALSWHRSPDSNRAFLVLQVREDENGNASLASLLSMCNGLVQQFGQPALYSAGDDVVAGGVDPPSSSAMAAILDRFHVSIAWSLFEVTDELQQLTAAVHERAGYSSLRRAGEVKIPVESVKVKIGNIVTNLPLPEVRRGEQSAKAGGLLAL